MDATEHTLFCRHCKAPFTKPAKRNFPSCFCSKRCWRLCKDYSPLRQECSCLTCGILFYLYPAQIASGEGDFCNKECAHQFYTREFKCLYCHKSFCLKLSRIANGGGKYCSMKCQHAFTRTADKERLCVICGVLFVAIRFRRNRTGGWSLVVRDKVATCSPACQYKNLNIHFGGGKHYVGRDATNWKGGTSSKLAGYRGPYWTKIAENVRKRQKFLCARCGKSQETNGRKLDVNHIVPWFNFTDHRKANVYDNLEALCRACHPQSEPRINCQIVFPFMNEKRRKNAGYIPHGALFTKEEVVGFRELYDQGTSAAALAKQVQVSRSVMWSMVTRRTYLYV